MEIQQVSLKDDANRMHMLRSSCRHLSLEGVRHQSARQSHRTGLTQSPIQRRAILGALCRSVWHCTGLYLFVKVLYGGIIMCFV